MDPTPEQLKEVITELEKENELLKVENNQLRRILRHLAQQMANAAIEVTEFLDTVDSTDWN